MHRHWSTSINWTEENCRVRVNRETISDNFLTEQLSDYNVYGDDDDNDKCDVENEGFSNLLKLKWTQILQLPRACIAEILNVINHKHNPNTIKEFGITANIAYK